MEEKIPFGKNITNRTVSQGAEEILFKTENTRDGSVEFIDYMGSDDMVERVATAGHGRKIFPENPRQEEFIEHLVAKGIYDPFTSVQMKFNIFGPIEMALNLVYLRRCSVNEYSGRFSQMIDSARKLNVITVAEMMNGNVDKARQVVELYDKSRSEGRSGYEQMLGLDFTRELSRSVLGINNDTQFFWKVNLKDLADFVKLQFKFQQRDSVTLPFIEKLSQAAIKVAPNSWKALMKDDPYLIDLTMPIDDLVVDPDLSPRSWDSSETKRITVQSIEDILFNPKLIFDHAAVQGVDYMGDDLALAHAARVSYGLGTKKVSNDIALINSLVRDFHTSPIEMSEFAIESKFQVFTDPRQAGRHRTLDNHRFMGYTPIGSQFYVPDEEEFKYQEKMNKQGRGKEMDPGDKEKTQNILVSTFHKQLWTAALMRELGAPEEIVRTIKGVGFYTRSWRIGDANNWGKFFKLRSHPHAQKEIREYSQAVEEIFEAQLPETYNAEKTYFLNGLNLSTREQSFLAEFSPFDREKIVEALNKDNRFSTPVDKNDPSKGRTLNREGAGFLGKLENMYKQKEYLLFSFNDKS